ncbi:hypothetical protein [Mucilaginibacter jinjuensis]|uniref:Lipoprotein n=1 Tax=Mucilaginibacter jinjuensis TaxID=1176721 RepID=A0ABY7TCJ7_9SPHI|nr:hypothetical protein [Mucilaginibacter jinjuensis]WCT14058.1 hypothetical protein PQO05_08935 [Mucilaginibacter jinjuensis]
MKLNLICASAIALLLFSCSNNNTQIAENTFIHGNKIYKIIDNELREIGDLDAKEIKKLEVSKPNQRNLGTSNLSFVKPGASTSLKALYRGNFLYYSLTLNGLNDLRENYQTGRITIEFVDEFGFILHSTEIPTTDLTGLVGPDGKPDSFVYNGKTEMSTEINSAIKTYNVTTSIKAKSHYSYY